VRGDGPNVQAFLRVIRECSPRARGWTEPRRAAIRIARRVPRVRGDGPPAVVASAITLAVFPACAGMDRWSASRTRARARCSPRARGWTAPGHGGGVRRAVFPACAGMDRITGPTAIALSTCSPRARGWTVGRIVLYERGARVPRVRGDGPRTLIAHEPNRRRVPRVRGDGPVETLTCACALAVFPACAGMDRPARRSRRCPGWCSPRARGWTGRRRADLVATRRVPRVRGDGPYGADLDLVKLGVFPACAGMDRGSASSVSRR